MDAAMRGEMRGWDLQPSLALVRSTGPPQPLSCHPLSYPSFISQSTPSLATYRMVPWNARRDNYRTARSAACIEHGRREAPTATRGRGGEGITGQQQ
jgi:hypothetical protein